MTSTSVGIEGLYTVLFVYVYLIVSVMYACVYSSKSLFFFFVMFYMSTKNIYISVALALTSER